MQILTKYNIGDFIEYTRGNRTYHGQVLEIDIQVGYGDVKVIHYLVDNGVSKRRHSVLEETASDPKLAI